MTRLVLRSILGTLFGSGMLFAQDSLPPTVAYTYASPPSLMKNGGERIGSVMPFETTNLLAAASIRVPAVLPTKEQARVWVVSDDSLKVKTRHPVRVGAIVGALIGAPVGFVAGGAIGTGCRNGPCNSAAKHRSFRLAGAAVGAVGGAVVGGLATFTATRLRRIGGS